MNRLIRKWHSSIILIKTEKSTRKSSSKVIITLSLNSSFLTNIPTISGINKAYEVLIDGNERAWYDSHREQILRGHEGQDMSKEEMEQASYGFNIWPYFSTNCFKGFDDSEKGFYTVYSSVFHRIANEELNAYKYYKETEDEDKRPEYISPPGNYSLSYIFKMNG